jgi:hypothetical protein
MNPDHPLHDDALLAELAALDELLRKPEEPAPPPTDFKVTEPLKRAPSSRVSGVSSRRRVSPSRERVAPALDRVEPARGLAVRSRATAVLRAAVAGRPARRRFRVPALWVAALSVGLLVGGLLGWWHAVNPVVVTPPEEAVEEPLRPTVPASKARGPSRSAKPVTAPRAAPAASSAAASPASAIANAAPSDSAPDVALPPASPAEAATIVAEIPVAPAPSIDLPPPAGPLPAAPLPVAPPAVAAAAAGGLAAAMVAADEAAIETTLRRYEDAYERLDAKAAAAVWPTVDRRALSHAFEGLASQRLNISGCAVLVRAGASTATASCSGTAEYVRKVGDTRVRVEPRQWMFTLNKTQGAWRIAAVDGSR